jgi:hypothetical protein
MKCPHGLLMNWPYTGGVNFIFMFDLTIFVLSLFFLLCSALRQILHVPRQLLSYCIVFLSSSYIVIWIIPMFYVLDFHLSSLQGQSCISLRPIILFANIDVSRHTLVVDTSVLAKSNMGRREY